MSSLPLSDLPANPTMRDINEFCTRHGYLSVAQGMIELPPPVLLRELAGTHVMRDEIHKYRPRAGDPEYLDAIHKLLEEKYALDVPRGAVCGAPGVSGGCFSVMAWAKSIGKRRVGLLNPFYTYHKLQAQTMFETTVCCIDSCEDFSPDFDAIIKALREEQVDLLVVCNPGNPHGRLLREDEVQKLIDIMAEYNAILIFDECYVDMVWTGSLISPFQHAQGNADNMPRHVACARGFSKCLSAQSWRLGYLIAHPDTIHQILRVTDSIYICLSWCQFPFADYVNNHFDDLMNHTTSVNALMRQNWKIMSTAFEKALGWKPLEPEGSMYGLFRHDRSTDLEAVLDALNLGVGVCPGSMFYGVHETGEHPQHTGFVRIQCGISDDKAERVAETLLASLSSASS